MDFFLKRYSSILLSDENDSLFRTLQVLIGGTTSIRTAKLLNFAVSQIGHDECYVETGVFTGCTLISANRNNGRKCIGIDPYEGMIEPADFTKVRAQARAYLEGLGEGAQLIEKDFRAVTKEEIGAPIAVSFIDAKHEYQDVLDNLEWLHPLLADHALIFFDDVNYLGVSQAISKWLSLHGATYDLTTYIKPFYKDDQSSWSVGDRLLNNGVCILRYHKDAVPLGMRIV